MMRCVILLTAITGLVFVAVTAQEAMAMQDPPVKIAMGPVSAPHLPSGTAQPEGSTSGCPQGSCSTPAKKAKHRHKRSSQH